MSFRSIFGAVILPTLIATSPATSFAETDDERNLIVLRPMERTMLLEDMRNYLTGIKQITLAIAKEDPQAIEKAARSMGKISVYEVKPVMTANLVPRFRDLGFALHEKFDALAEAAAAGREPLQLLSDLSLLMTQCVKCHESYKVGDYSHDIRQ
ncbi:MAG: hypothetical protein V7752_16700 [Halopseudomonas sp.]